jgi:hypothetical protein
VPLLDGQALATMLVVFVVVGLLVVALRWTFSGSAVRNPAPERRPSDDFGLLTPVAVVESADEAQRLRAVLAEAGIRATWTVGTDGRHRVLVFATEVDRARNIAGWPT